MTERIYYTEPSCRAFDAVVVRALQHDGHPAAVLNRTAFYPTSGGQPFDTGALDGVRVVDTVDDGADVLHVLASPLTEGAQVHGEIDWPRRFDHMQQHSGQHVLSAAFERVGSNATVSFHLGAEACTIDLAREVSADDIRRAEDEANRVVWDDLPVGIRFAAADAAESLGLRKESKREGTLRLIEVPGFDISACGGTHVASTGAIGLIAVVGWERVKAGSRITFVCGGRALRSLRTLRESVAGSIRLLSVHPDELPDAIARLQEDAKTKGKQLRDAQDQLARAQGAALLDEAAVIAGVRLVVKVVDGSDAAGLKAIAAGAAGAGHAAVALLTDVTPPQLVIARSLGVAVDAGAVMRQVVERFGGKGGGKPDLAQGGGFTGDVRELVWAISGLLEEALQRS